VLGEVLRASNVNSQTLLSTTQRQSVYCIDSGYSSEALQIPQQLWREFAETRYTIRGVYVFFKAATKKSFPLKVCKSRNSTPPRKNIKELLIVAECRWC
ncbi:MAG: hypothetical protein V2I76_14435, partial [Roseobacter sp.]|nr:hypothetical protein [Roseobacter sp.]